MLNIVKKIFQVHNFEKIQCDSLHLFKPVNRDKQSFWLVIEDEPKQILENQSNINDNCKEIVDDPAFDKNSNILCLWKVPKINTQIFEYVHKVEEDTYFFKKHVLYYSKKEEQLFNQVLTNKKLKDVIDNEVTDANVFDQYKNIIALGGQNETYLCLLYRLCIKLTFIKIKENTTKVIDDLYSNHKNMINDNIDSKKLTTLERIVLSEDITNTDDDANILLNSILTHLEETGHDI